MGSFLETVYDVLFKPTKAMQYIAEQKLTGQALAVFIVSMLVPVWAVYTGVKGSSVTLAFGIMFSLHFIGSLILWALSAAVLSFIAELLGGRGTAVGLFAALGFTHLPRVAVMPLWVIAAILPASGRGAAMGFVGLVIVLWTLALDVAALRGAHGLSGAKAVLALALPILVLIGVAVTVVIFVSSTVMFWPFKV